MWLHSVTHCWGKKKISAGTWLPFGKDIDLTGVCYVVALCCTLLKKKKKILCRHMVALWERYWHICVLLFGCTLHSFEGRHLNRYLVASLGRYWPDWVLLCGWERYWPDWVLLCGCTLLHTVDKGKDNSLQALGHSLGKILAYLGFVIWLLTVTGTVTYFWWRKRHVFDGT